MRKLKFATRIKFGRTLSIPPAVIKRLGTKVGSKVDFKITNSGEISLTKSLSAQERRIARLHERLNFAWKRQRAVGL